MVDYYPIPKNHKQPQFELLSLEQRVKQDQPERCRRE
jgi:hypothetical protein